MVFPKLNQNQWDEKYISGPWWVFVKLNTLPIQLSYLVTIKEHKGKVKA